MIGIIIIITIGLWSAVGLLILGVCAACDIDLIRYSDGWEFVNPLEIYKNVQVNWFGAFLLALVLNLVCPIASIAYWIYKLCTIGRR